ncbi:MAG: hypothetical protein GY845_23620 [Planctomycetes bacterium]|nr:hypothetical protein [Planctomycetota bacterium]
MKARIAMQDFSQAGGKHVYPNLVLVRPIRREYVVGSQYLNADLSGSDLESYRKSLERSGLYIETIDKALETFAQACFEMGFSHVFNVTIDEDDRHIVLTGDGYTEG